MKKSPFRLALILGCFSLGMLGLAFASVPLYRMFCDVTGFNGATRKASAPLNAETPIDVKVRFDVNTRDIDWDFKPEKPSQAIKVGKTALAYFTVTNHSPISVTGRATYNVLPEEMGGYFMKMECFCFTDQTLKPGETKKFPMVYYLDPEMLKDIDTKNVRDITLSYTFFETPPPASPNKPQA